MKIAVSACLLGDNCKYSGGNNYNEKLHEFLKDHEVIPICPEVMGGLPIPRPSAEIRDGIVMNKEGKSVDKEFRTGATIALNKCIENDVELIILQSRSPSCGVKEIYDGSFSKRRIKGMGIFARLASENHFQLLDIEDL